jgi:Undecaprenyl-phosphate galactose phosphotransferase WbaP
MIDTVTSELESQASLISDNSIDFPVKRIVGTTNNELFTGTLRTVAWTRQRHLQFFMQAASFGLPLLMADLVTATGLFVVFCWILQTTASLFGEAAAWSTISSVGWFSVQLVSLVGSMLAFRLYSNVGMHPVVELEKVVQAVLVAYVPLIAIALLSPRHYSLQESVLLSVVLAGMLLILPSLRHLLRCWLGRTSWWGNPLVLVTGRGNVFDLSNRINRERHLGWRIVGYIDDFHQNFNRELQEQTKADIECLGDESDFGSVVQKRNIFWTMLDARQLPPGDVEKFMDRHQRDIPHIVAVTGDCNGHQLFTSGMNCGSAKGIHHRNHLSLIVPRTMKRALDVFVAGTVLLLLSPIVAFIVAAIKWTSPGPIFYSQDRIGLGGKTFKIWKFRSMVPNADKVLRECLENDPTLAAEWAATQKLTNDPRISGIGRLLRKTSLDELPQLWNVLNGSMSLVGPRPIVRSEIAKYGDVYWLYARSKPGITGLWQVNGRNNTTYEERLAYDTFYVRNWSIWFDWYILLKTFRVVVLCEGAY